MQCAIIYESQVVFIQKQQKKRRTDRQTVTVHSEAVALDHTCKDVTPYPYVHLAVSMAQELGQKGYSPVPYLTTRGKLLASCFTITILECPTTEMGISYTDTYIMVHVRP